MKSVQKSGQKKPARRLPSRVFRQEPQPRLNLGPSPEGLLSKQEAAARLGVSERTLCYWMARNWLDIRYLSRRRVYITEESVAFWLQPRRKTPATKNLPWKRKPEPRLEKPGLPGSPAVAPTGTEARQRNGRAEPQSAPDNNS